MRWATYASVSVATCLIGAKLLAWSLSGSVSLLATLVDSGLDALASLINLFAVHHALSPADEEHRFGHGKAEALAGLGQASLILASGCFLLYEAVGRLLAPEPIAAVAAGMWVMVLSIGLTLALLRFQRHVIARTGSTAIQADALHYRTDLLVNGSVLLALVLATWGWVGFDALFALAIGAYILYSAWDILRRAADHLMDRELPDEDRAKIEALVAQHPAIHGFHDLRTRSSGTASFIQLHIELEDELSLLQAHQISVEIEQIIEQAFPGAEVLIHLDPLSVVDVERRQTF
ncbi:cation diffusion facilitator family transporter [Halioglobus maricola]|uniref:Cation-efflux pump FieF n=2 Tax=Halioglobus maricola TaxID=2601894 RepID=A0A5P9NQH4_9GAMM|nr:cation diffusion facilitator family transporter [Halioglobus maricola]QFU77736.1 cation diffusion facilitator family transporter [Halioglobus maricola]